MRDHETFSEGCDPLLVCILVLMGAGRKRMGGEQRKMNITRVIEAAARAAHEANRAYCIALGDESQFGWDAAPDWQRQSSRVGARGVLNGDTPEQSHESWLEVKAAEGWRHGETKDAELKTHPCLVPYAELPEEQKKKDEIFVTVVRSVALALGWSA